jgi:hypothetical protein
VTVTAIFAGGADGSIVVMDAEGNEQRRMQAGPSSLAGLQGRSLLYLHLLLRLDRHKDGRYLYSHSLRDAQTLVTPLTLLLSAR